MYDDDFGDGYGNEMQRHCAAVRGGLLSHADTDECDCGGCGWILTGCDTWEKCPIHWNPGKANPDI